MKITAVITAFSEEEKLEPVLKSVTGVADEVIIASSFSSDETLRIVKKYHCRLVQRKASDYAELRNFANTYASFPWVLSLGEDERVSTELREEILRLKETQPEYSAFSIPIRSFYLGKVIRNYGWYSDQKERLFKKEKARWGEEQVSEKLLVDGKVGELKGYINHFSSRLIADYLKRINIFSQLEAQKLYTQKKKCRWYHLFISPIARCVKIFLFKLGFLDGFPGLVLSVLSGYEVFIRYARLKEIWKKGERIEPFPY